MTLSTWVWFRLYGKVLPLLKKGKEQEQLDKLTEELTTTKDSLMKGKFFCKMTLENKAKLK